MNRIPTALTIAGSDSGGGAGIQADLKTFGAKGCYGMSVITAVTAQNTVGVQGIFTIPPEFVGKQIESIFTDFPVDSVKVGMLGNEEIINIVTKLLIQFQAKNIVVDPVIVSKTGAQLLSSSSLTVFKEQLFPISEVITPNIPEACALLGVETIQDLNDMKKAAIQLQQLGAKHVLLKGGHLLHSETSPDVFFDGKELIELQSERFHTQHTHGTGCTYSACISAFLAKGENLLEAINHAKLYISGAIKDSAMREPLGKGYGPLDHFYEKRLEF